MDPHEDPLYALSQIPAPSPQPQTMDIRPGDPMYDLQMEREKQEWARMAADQAKADEAQRKAAALAPSPYAGMYNHRDTIGPLTPEMQRSFDEQERHKQDLENCETLPAEPREMCKKIVGGDPNRPWGDEQVETETPEIE
jgi:hypothetical protein